MPTSCLSEEERRELAEYERIVQFVQQVLSGTHPRVKLPPRSRNPQSLKRQDSGKSITIATQPPVELMDAMRISSMTRNPFPYEIPCAALQTSIQTETSSRFDVTAMSPRFSSVRTLSEIEEQAPSLGSFIIDYKHNYYKDLGINPTDSHTSVLRGYRSKEQVWSPVFSKERWLSNDMAVRDRTRDAWDRAQKAYIILSDSALRRHYDSRYMGPAHHSPPGGPSAPTVKEKENEQAQRAAQAAKTRRQNTIGRLNYSNSRLAEKSARNRHERVARHSTGRRSQLSGSSSTVTGAKPVQPKLSPRPISELRPMQNKGRSKIDAVEAAGVGRLVTDPAHGKLQRTPNK